MDKMILGLFITSLLNRNYNQLQSAYWIRVLQMKEYYKRLGIDIHINNFFKKYDVCIYYSGMGKKKTPYIIKYLKRISKKVYWDICVNYFEKHSQNTDFQVDLTDKILKLVDGVIVSTDFLKDRAIRKHHNIFVMPDPIDIEYFSHTKKNINFSNPIFIWSGVSVKSIFLNKYRDIISNRIVLITDNNINNIDLGFKYDFIPWKYETFPQTILSGDICFAPRNTNNRYDLSHSAFKILVFANARMPIITNKLPSYVQLGSIYDGLEFLEDNNNDVLACVDKLKTKALDNTPLQKEYSCETISKNLIGYLKQELKNKQ